MNPSRPTLYRAWFRGKEADEAVRTADAGDQRPRPDWHARKGDRDRKIRAHLRRLQALGLDVTITPAA